MLFSSPGLSQYEIGTFVTMRKTMKVVTGGGDYESVTETCARSLSSPALMCQCSDQYLLEKSANQYFCILVTRSANMPTSYLSALRPLAQFHYDLAFRSKQAIPIITAPVVDEKGAKARLRARFVV